MDALGNLFADVPKMLRDEQFTNLAMGAGVRIERIVSQGQASPEGFWYDQDQNEWVMVLKGKAKLRFENPDQIVEMSAGDHITIPEHTRHRVEWTSPDELTVWLAVHYETPS